MPSQNIAIMNAPIYDGIPLGPTPRGLIEGINVNQPVKS